jgi:AcrR family transcriptional regulator
MDTLKEKILEKAMLLFLTKDYGDVSISDIQNAAECSRGAMYHHYKNKEEIFREVVKKYVLPAFSNFSIIPENKRETLRGAIDASVQFRKKYIGLFRNIISPKLSDFYFFKLIFQVEEHYKGFVEIVNMLSASEMNIWEDIIQKSISEGEIKESIDVDLVAQYYTMLPYGLGLFKALKKKNLGSEDIKASYIKFYELIKNTEKA